MMIDKDNQEEMLASLDRVMRLLRRRPAGKQHVGRGVYRILSIVQENEGISTRELSELLDLRTSSLNEKLARLEQEEMLLRVRDTRDQRSFVVKLQSKGEEHLEAIRMERKQLNKAIGSILAEEESRELTQLLLKLADGIEQLRHPLELEHKPHQNGRDN